ncbi:hypothetical protein AMS62_16305 [Bacillus sp. FJAT-18019]|nr:hypothetical protein AMS62_16305 [Bacillus sp. FJAT-18019]
MQFVVGIVSNDKSKSEAVLTNLDVLGYLDDIPVCIGYELEDGSIIDHFPVTADLQSAKPVLRTLKGWKCTCRTSAPSTSSRKPRRNTCSLLNRPLVYPSRRSPSARDGIRL